MLLFIFLEKILLAVLLGAITGWERERAGKKAGIRTHALVSFSAALFTMMSREAFGDGDPARIAAQVLVGIGFIGAGTIMHKEGVVEGLTTAAGLWAVTAIGMLVGVGWYTESLIATGIMFLILRINDRKLV